MTDEELNNIKDRLALGWAYIAPSDISALIAEIERLQKFRWFEPKSSGDVHHGEEFFTIERHVVEAYSATEHVSPGYKTSGNPMIGPAKTVYIEQRPEFDEGNK